MLSGDGETSSGKSSGLAVEREKSPEATGGMLNLVWPVELRHVNMT